MACQPMCWSPAVTGLVLAFELACCGVLLARGERWFIFGMAPLIVQEAVSLALWREIAQDEQSGRSGCSQWNHELTFVLGVVVGGLVPLCFAVMTKRSIERWIDAVSHAVDLRSHIPGEFDEGRALTSTLDEYAPPSLDRHPPRISATSASRRSALPSCAARSALKKARVVAPLPLRAKAQTMPPLLW